MGQSNFTRNAIIFALIVFVGRVAIHKLFDKSVHKGDGYTISVPEGWEKNEIDADTVMFIAPERDYIKETPVAMISVYSKMSKGALWIEDLWPKVLSSLKQERIEILKKGEIKIDDIVSKWVLFKKEEEDLLVLTFYLVDEFNRMYRLQYATKMDKFKDYRQTFEDMKDTFKIKKILRR